MVEVAIVAFAVVVIAALILGRQISIRIGQMHATVEAVNRAVNHKPRGAAPLSRQVDELVDVTHRTEAKVDELDGRMGACEAKLCEIADDAA